MAALPTRSSSRRIVLAALSPPRLPLSTPSYSLRSHSQVAQSLSSAPHFPLRSSSLPVPSINHVPPRASSRLLSRIASNRSNGSHPQLAVTSSSSSSSSSVSLRSGSDASLLINNRINR